MITQVVYTVSPKTKTSQVPPQSFLSQNHNNKDKKKISFWRHSSLLDSFTPAWKRFSNIKYYQFYLLNSIFLEGATTCLTFTARETRRPI